MESSTRTFAWFLLPLLVSFTITLWAGRLARADGPPRATLVPDEPPDRGIETPADSSGPEAPAPRRPIADDPDYRLAPRSPGRHTTIRRVALVSGVGFAAVALWRDLVADDRAQKYDDAIFTSSATRFRESVRSAERERNVAASLSALSFSVALLTFVY